VEAVHTNHLDLIVHPFNNSLISLHIEQVYLSSAATDTYLIYLQPDFTQAKLIGQALANNNTVQRLNFTVATRDQSSRLLQFTFNFPTDLVNLIASSCRLSVSVSDSSLSLANPSVNSVLAEVRPHFTSTYGIDSACQLFLSENLWLSQNLFHTVFAEAQPQAHLKINAHTGRIRMNKLFYGKLVFQFSARLFFRELALRAAEFVSLQIVSVDERPSLNNSMPIHASVGLSSTSPTLPVVTYFRKTSTQNVFDSIELTVAGDLAEFSLAEVLQALNWNYNEFSSYDLVYCFDTNSLQKFETCPLQLQASGTLTVSAEKSGVSLLLRLGGPAVAQIKYLNLSVRNSSASVEFESENCTVLVRRGSQPGDQLVGRMNFEQSQVVPVLLFRMAVRQNETTSRFKFSLAEMDEKPDKTNQLNQCFQVDPDTGDVFFKCKWPFAHHSLFAAGERVARIEKLLRLKVRKYPANVDAHTFLNVQFELTADNNSLSDSQQAKFSVMMFNCAKAFAATDATHLRQNYLINKLLANDFRHLLRRLRSRQILQAHSHESVPIPAQTDIYRIDLAYVLRQLRLDDPNDEAVLYELNQIGANDTGLFRLNRLTGLVTLAVDWTPMLGFDNVHRLHFNATKSFRLASGSTNARNSFDFVQFTANIRFRVKNVGISHLPRPVMAAHAVRLSLINPKPEQKIMNAPEAFLIDSSLNVSSVYTLSYRLGSDKADSVFYVDPMTGNLYLAATAAITEATKKRPRQSASNILVAGRLTRKFPQAPVKIV